MQPCELCKQKLTKKEYINIHFDTNMQNQEKFCQKLKYILTELEDKRHELRDLQ
jgi:hypothetical protein